MKKEYRGGSVPVPTGLMVCASCDDVPQPYFRRLLLRPDPVPVRNPRPDYNPTNYILDEDGTQIIAGENYDSTTSLQIGVGQKLLTIDAGVAVQIPSSVTITYNASNVMEGTVENYVPETGEFAVNVTAFNGSGTYDNWTVALFQLFIQD
jgi:hypothetical protein